MTWDLLTCLVHKEAQLNAFALEADRRALTAVCLPFAVDFTATSLKVYSSVWCTVLSEMHFGGTHSAIRVGKSVISKMSHTQRYTHPPINRA